MTRPTGMTRPTDPLFDQRIADWLEDDPVQAPGQVLEIVLAALPSIPRRRASRVSWRFTSMPTSIRWPIAAAAVLAVVAVAGALYLNRPSQPAVGGPSPIPGVSASPIASAVPSASARAASWTATGSMARSRYGAVAVPLQDGMVLVIGGNSNVADPAAELYDPSTGTWTASGPMVNRLQFTATRLLDGRVLVAAGGDEQGLASAEIFDPTTRTWAATGSPRTLRYAATATLLPDGKVLLAGGDTVTHFFNPSIASAELYDPGTGSWTPTGSMGTARSWHTATLLGNGKVLVAGGTNENDTLSFGLASAELYDPGTGMWTAAKDMTQVRSSHTATALGDGRVLVVGGSCGCDEGISATAEVYDPTTGSWTGAGSLSAPLEGFTATLLPDGRVLVTGGMDTRPVNASDAPASAAAELYDPRTDRWESTVDMVQVRTGHSAALLPDGTVLVAGGISVRGSYSGETPSHNTGWLYSAEVYDPGSGTR